MSAEMANAPVMVIMGATLQWGRAQMSAEILLRDGPATRRDVTSMGPRSGERGTYVLSCLQRRQRYASMGPRSGERGNINTGFPTNPCNMLQWGRAQVRAEIAACGTL